MSAKSAFATRLRELRVMAELSQVELADKLGMSRGSISFYENAERVADIEFLYSCAVFFGIEPRYLLGLSDNAYLESQDIGMITGLSDKAIYKLKEETIDKEFFNYLVEHGRFDDFMALLADYSNGSYEPCGTKGIDDVDYVTFLVTQVLLDIVKDISGAYKGKEFLDDVRQGRPYDVVLTDFQKSPEWRNKNIVRAFNEPNTTPYDKKDNEAIRQRVRAKILGIKDGESHA
jgi:transcriptional regulator with XRE-family HTH domain